MKKIGDRVNVVVHVLEIRPTSYSIVTAPRRQSPTPLCDKFHDRLICEPDKALFLCFIFDITIVQRDYIT
jgi:hypothetical protein